MAKQKSDGSAVKGPRKSTRPRTTPKRIKKDFVLGSQPLVIGDKKTQGKKRPAVAMAVDGGPGPGPSAPKKSKVAKKLTIRGSPVKVRGGLSIFRCHSHRLQM
jgi:hypothetical protein